MWLQIIFVAIIFYIILCHLHKDYVILLCCRRIKTFDGSALDAIAPTSHGKTIFGNTFDIMRYNPEQLFYYLRDLAAKLKRSYIQYIILNPIYNVIDAEAAELVLTDTNLITKAEVYSYLQPFLGTGLLTSSGEKWQKRRKLLTPAFHFNILTQFEEIFKQESAKFVRNIAEKHIQSGQNVISLSDLVPRLTLNNICETALGVKLDERLDSDEYRVNIEKIENCFVKRVTCTLLMFDILYKTFGGGWQDIKHIRKLHAFSVGIISQRRQHFEATLTTRKTTNELNSDDTSYIYGKQRYAMLDTLLQAEKDGLIDHAGICEEVDTFMFRGFDTASMNLIFVLMNLALYPEMQQLCFEEIQEVIEDDLSCLDIAQLNKLKYLECFIKETQRLYPSVPLILRACVRDTRLANGLLLPKGTQIPVHIFDVHRNPRHYDEPEEFRPTRFTPENCAERHPFAFIPFSAGQRNCIGQKFAMLEIKTLLVYVLKQFRLLPVTDPKTFRFKAGIIIRSQADVKIKIVKR